ncbi:MAG TPA: peptidylprolyl isomerase [Bacteroidales bacterium]|jgi:cyclophilin family peptidyl-prolyl cis-trans isomerase|nr:peptidylprolyl isomerase [Bacteroidales bacterium]HOU98701.1 peptidylprolyl isomerase [Bacteroidales bacterium]
MYKPHILILLLFFCFGFTIQNSKNPIVVIKTQYGLIKIKLYDETPKHRDNFIKLVKEHYYDSLLFHRVINSFMIQGGDPDSKHAQPGQMLGNGGPNYTIPAEFVPTIYHKRGALAAARESDQVNPTKASSGSQFYIVQGKVFTNDELNYLEQKINGTKKNQLLGQMMNTPEYSWLKTKLDSMIKSGNPNAVQDFINETSAIAEKELNKAGRFHFTPEQRKLYTTIGGAPHLDGSYTVFGEVIEGMNVVDSIASVSRDKNDRPINDIRMFIYLEEK